MRSDRERLLDIVEAIERIQRQTLKGRALFERDELIQVWVIHHIEIIGGAARRVSPKLRAAYPKLPWSQMVAMRNVPAHDYFGIDAEAVWVTVEQDLPRVRQQIEALLPEETDG